jgi:prevent-host-death family protein
MKVNATEARNHFGQMLKHAQLEPVMIVKSGRPPVMLISAEHYDELLLAHVPRPRSASSSPSVGINEPQ